MTTLSDRCDEAMARTMCKAHGTGQCAALCLTHSSNFTTKGGCPEAIRVHGRMARAARLALLAALDAERFKIVETEPNEAQMDAYHTALDEWRRIRETKPMSWLHPSFVVWQAMLAAAPHPFPEDKP